MRFDLPPGLPRVLALALAFALCACQAASPAGGPEANCARTCQGSAAGCSPTQCARGCNLILDRLAEHEGGHVLACVAQASSHACDDRAWSRCALRVGPHADGGPPAPPAPHDVDVEGD